MVASKASRVATATLLLVGIAALLLLTLPVLAFEALLTGIQASMLRAIEHLVFVHRTLAAAALRTAKDLRQ
jgi:hypothetical protein